MLPQGASAVESDPPVWEQEILMPSPAPPKWVSYDSGASQITIQWDTVPTAVSYQIYWTDISDTSYGPVEVVAPATTGLVDCQGLNDGRSLFVEIGYTNSDGELSPRSIAITMVCAGYPDAPQAPVEVLGNRDIISVSWSHPASDSGSPVLGFFVFMKTVAEADYTLVQNGGEDPTLLEYSTTLDHLGNPIAPNDY